MGPVTIEIVPRGILWSAPEWTREQTLGFGGISYTPASAGFMPWEIVNLVKHTTNGQVKLTTFHAHERSGKNGLALEGENAVIAWEAWKAWIRTQAEIRP